MRAQINYSNSNDQPMKNGHPFHFFSDENNVNTPAHETFNGVQSQHSPAASPRDILRIEKMGEKNDSSNRVRSSERADGSGG